MGLLERLDKDKAKTTATETQAEEVEKEVDPFDLLKSDIKNELVQLMMNNDKFAKLKKDSEKRDFLRPEIQKIAMKKVTEKNLPYSPTKNKELVKDLLDDIVGMGPIQDLIYDEEVSEIMVNGPRHVFVERGGQVTLSDKTFRDNEHVMQIIEKIISPLGRRCDESTPMVDARLKDGSRVNAIIPPLALNGPTITIRKFKKDALTIDSLVNFDSITRQCADFLNACVLSRLNIVVSGGTGSGKTTLLNILSNFIPDGERIITVEDAAELQIQKQHVVSLETRPANIEGKGAVTIRDLVKNTLRMRPERVVVGECRGGEALDMLQAMNTGHDGSLTTGHANTPRDMISRLETMVMMSGMDLPIKAIREQIASAVDMIVQQARLRDGSRKVTRITEVQGMEGETVILQDIFVFEQQGLDSKNKIIGRLKPTGIRPKFLHRFEEEGIPIPADIFVDKTRSW